MKTKKIEQNWLTKKIWFGKSFYALVCWFVLALAGWSYFIVSAAGDLQIQTDIDNALQTIQRIIVTSDGTSAGDKYFDFNPGGSEAAYFKFDRIPSRPITQDLGIDNNGFLVKEVPANIADDWDWVKSLNNVYKTWNVSIWDLSPVFVWNLNVVSSQWSTPELYMKQSTNSAANIHFVDMNDNEWSLWAMPNLTNSYFYIGIAWSTNSFYINKNWDAGINSDFVISWSLNMSNRDINNANIVNATLFVQTSDKDFKENIKTIKNPLDKIYALNGYTFDWKDEFVKNWKKHDIWLIAQDVEKVLPELVVDIDTNGHKWKWVQYSNMVALLIEWIKELWNKIDWLYGKYLDQQEQIKNLELRIEKLENK
jgi:hypothetical protein